MTLVSSVIPNLINGVSQQADPLRLVSQCAAQVNGYSTPTDGLKKRPPLNHFVKLKTHAIDNDYIVETKQEAVADVVTEITENGINIVQYSTASPTTPEGFVLYLNEYDSELYTGGTDGNEVVITIDGVDYTYDIISSCNTEDELLQAIADMINSEGLGITATKAFSAVYIIHDTDNVDFTCTASLYNRDDGCYAIEYIDLYTGCSYAAGDIVTVTVNGTDYQRTMTANLPMDIATLRNTINAASGVAATLVYREWPNETYPKGIDIYSVTHGVTLTVSVEHTTAETSKTNSAFIHTINRDDSERYVVTIADGDLKVFDVINGTEKTIKFSNGDAFSASDSRANYIDTTNAEQNIRAITIGDYTFMINRTKKVTKATTKSASRNPEALIWIKQADYATKYSVIIDGNTFEHVSYRKADSTSWTSSPYESKVTTEFIAKDLYNMITGGSSIHVESKADDSGTYGVAPHDDVEPLDLDDYTVELIGSTIYITRTDGSDMSIETSDGLGDQGIFGIMGSIQNFTDLPERGKGGFTIEVTGDAGSTNDNYWVTYNDDDTASGDGVWEETLKPDEYIAFSDSTMPHVLIRQSDGTFTFQEAVWLDRQVGDIDTNPFPSFVDKYIQDIFFYANRLGFIADENVILSRAGDSYDWFRATATQIEDDDPIDIRVNDVHISILKHAIPYQDKVLLFSDQSQFMLKGDPLVTPESVIVSAVSRYDNSLRAKPLAHGSMCYFATDRTSSTNIMEFFNNVDKDVYEAENICGHVPSYLKGKPIQIAGSTNDNILTILTDNDRNILYVYKYFWSGNKRLQSCWSTWELPTDDVVLSVDFMDSIAYVIVNRVDGLYMDTVNLEEGYTDENSDTVIHLDRRCTEDDCSSVTYTDGYTTFTLPYYHRDNTDGTLVICTRNTENGETEGTVYTVVRDSPTTAKIEGNLTSTPVWIGVQYTFTYEFSKFFPREQTSGGGVAATTDCRLQLRYLNLKYSNTGHFQIRVTPERRTAYTYTFIGDTLIDSGDYRCPIMVNNLEATIEIISSSVLGCAFQGASWEGMLKLRARRV